MTAEATVARSSIAIILDYMTPEQARIATRGMNAKEMGLLAGTLQFDVKADEMAAFIEGMTTDPEL